MRTLALAVAMLGVATVAVAQTADQAAPPTAPRVRGFTGDPRDWESWFDHGVRVLRVAPREAAAAFAWSARLDPTRAEPHFAFYAATMLVLPRERTVQYFRGDAEAMGDPRVLAADSARTLGLMRNPLVHRGLEAVMFDALPGSFRDDRDTRAWIAYSNGELLQAVRLHTRTIDRLGERARWQLFDRALAYAASGDSRAALQDLRRLHEALKTDEESASVTFYRSKHFLLQMIGTLQLRNSDVTGAQASFAEALVEDASFAYAHAGLAQVARAQQRFGDAVEALNLAIELNDRDAVFYHARGASQLSLSNFAEALADFRRAAELQPLWPAPVLAQAMVLERQRQDEGARTLYLRYLEMAPASDPQARSIRQRLGVGAP